MGILDGSLAQSIYDGFKGKLLSGIIRQEVAPESGALDDLGDPIDLASTDTTIEGFTENYDALYISRSGLPKDSIKVNIFAKSCDGITPTRDNLVRFEQAAVSTWYQLRRVQIDPAGALWQCPDAFEVPAP